MPGPDLGPDFDGDVGYVRAQDHGRLISQLGRVYMVMSDHKWRSAKRVGEITGDPPASVQARIRDLRKEKFGQFRVDRRQKSPGYWQFRLVGGRGDGEPEAKHCAQCIVLQADLDQVEAENRRLRKKVNRLIKRSRRAEG